MAKRPNPIHPIIDAFCKQWSGIAYNLKRSIAGYIKQGDKPDVAVVKAFANTRAGDATVRAVFGSVVAAFVKGAASLLIGKVSPDNSDVERFVRSSWLNRSFDTGLNGTGVFRLSDKIHGLADENKRLVLDATRQQMYLGKSWQKVATEIYKTGVVRGDVTKIIPLLHKRARLALATSKDFVEYRRRIDADIDAAQAYVDRLGDNGAPNQRLKAAYQRVIDATEKGSEKAMQNAIERAIDNKARYNAERVARTETARAWGQTQFNKMLGDDDVIGYRWELSSRHPNFDICDFNSTANLYGMGAGVYPKDSGPSYPAHPHCTCNMVEVYHGEVPASNGFDPDAGKRHLASLPPSAQKELLGKSGRDAFREGADWQKHLKSWSGEVPKVRVDIVDKAWEKETNYRDKVAAGIIQKPPQGAASSAALPQQVPKQKSEPTTKRIPPETPTAVVERVEEVISLRRFETLISVDSFTGKILGRRGGNHNSVNVEGMNLKNAIVSHNHPAGWSKPKSDARRAGNSFSSADFNVSALFDVAEMRAVTPMYVFSVKRPKNGWPSAESIKNIYPNIDARVKANSMKKYHSGSATLPELEANNYHEVSRFLCKVMKAEYSREEFKRF